MESTATNCSTWQELTGKLRRVIFYNSSDGFHSMMVSLDAPPNKGVHRMTARSSKLTAGDLIQCYGKWGDDTRYGEEFKASVIRVLPPQTRDGMVKYLRSGLIKGVGPKLARRIVKAFGDGTFRVLKRKPELSLKLLRVSNRKAQIILQSLKENWESQDAMVFLHHRGIGTKMAMKIYQVYGNATITKISKNPYRLIDDIEGIGFAVADRIALSLGISKDSTFRLESGIKHILQEQEHNGSCAMWVLTLIAKAERQLSVINESVKKALRSLYEQKHIVYEPCNNTGLILLKSTYDAECSIAKDLYLLNQSAPVWYDGIDVEIEIANVQKHSNIQLSDSQIAAVKTAICNKVTIITGGPGTGKTTVAKAILQLISKHTSKILLAAPTGKAAKRLSEATGMEATTIHRMLECKGKNYSFNRNSDNLLEARFVLIDEASMLDVFLFKATLAAMPRDATLILIGDVDQLPSVRAGSVLHDLINSRHIAFVRLNTIFRQDEGSQIIKVSHDIIKGIPHTYTSFDEPEKLHLSLKERDFYLVKMAKTEKEYTLALLADLQPQQQFDQRKVYLKLEDGIVHYKVLSSENIEHVGQITTQDLSGSVAFPAGNTLEQFSQIKDDILKVTSRRGHTPVLNPYSAVPGQVLSVIAEVQTALELSDEDLKQGVQLLTPVKKSETGTIELNKLLQKRFNPNVNDPKKSISRLGSTFAVGDKVIQMVNNYSKAVFNGESGIIESIDLENKLLQICFDDRLVSYAFTELEDVKLAYAITVHKSQGSEYPVVIMPICEQHSMLLQRNLIYTGVTRGKQLVVVIAEQEALNLAVSNRRFRPRLTRLKQKIIYQFAG